MNYAVLRAFTRIAQAGSFSKAARELYISQPTLSGSIATLERELGFALFTRDNRGARLTPAGEVFYPRALEILRLSDEALRLAREAAGLEEGSIRIGCNWHDNMFMLSAICENLAQGERPISFEFIHCDMRKIVELLVKNGADLCVAYSGRALRENGLDFLPLFEDGIQCFLPAGHPLSGRESLELSDLRGETLLLPPPGICAMADDMRAQMEAQGFPIHICHDIDREALPAILRAKRILVIQPAFMRANIGRGSCIPFRWRLPIRVGLAYHPRPKPAIQRFLAEAQRIYAKRP